MDSILYYMMFNIAFALVALQPFNPSISKLTKTSQYRKTISRSCIVQPCSLKTKKHSNWGLSKLNHPYKNDNTFDFPENAGQNVAVYVIDTGLTLGHDDYEYPVRRVDVTSSNTVKDEYGHGTKVASIIAGKNNGVAKYAEVISVKVLSNTEFKLIEGLQFVIDDVQLHNKKSVINLSVGYNYKYFDTAILRSKIRTLIDMGVVIVDAAGNDSEFAGHRDVLTSINGLIVVGSINKDNRVSTFSNYGQQIDLFAPGGDVAYDRNIMGFKNKQSIDGTSFSSPYVAGVVATYLSSGIEPEDMLKTLIKNSHKGFIESDGLHGSPNRIVNNIL